MKQSFVFVCGVAASRTVLPSSSCTNSAAVILPNPADPPGYELVFDATRSKILLFFFFSCYIVIIFL